MKQIHPSKSEQESSDGSLTRQTHTLLLDFLSTLQLPGLGKLHVHGPIPVRTAAWYPVSSTGRGAKPLPTFSDAIATVRRELWPMASGYSMSPSQPDIVKVPRALLDSLLNMACYAT